MFRFEKQNWKLGSFNVMNILIVIMDLSAWRSVKMSTMLGDYRK